MNLVKSDKDKRQFRLITLDNGMQVVLVSAEVTQAAACMFVKAGAHYDTIDGIAHLLEHMLFLGSEKYPDDNHYQTLLS